LADEFETQGRGVKGRIARFACGRDYHIEVEERLKQLGEWLSTQIGAKYRICVDTGPMIDRAAAQQSGIGSYGKNAAIITKEAGSWVVIGELIVDIELDYDKPAPTEQCGSCNICLNTCPSGAIVSPFIIDQTKCISHLTQMKGIIPRELRSIIGDRIYGCDACQEVCPKNSNTSATQSSLLIPHFVSLITLLNISQEDFDRVIGPTAIAWIGRARFRRNVAIALGNIADSEAVTELIKALHDSEPIVRVHAAWALRRIRTPEAMEALAKLLRDEDDKIVIEELRAALAG
jgi:epoxyqueuosine reductase